MYQLKSLDDTIVAISTPPGQGGIGIIRLSGKQALSIADQMFESKDKSRLSTFHNFTAHYGWIVKDQTDRIDEVLLTIMRGPKSYTKEDVVEISCHGGMVSLRAILNFALNCSARLAEPGEFTKRAFLNGRIDLTQAEAVLDIIQAKTDMFLRVSTNQLQGELSTELEAIREQLMNIYIELEAVVNFPEDDIDAQGRENITLQIQGAQKRVEVLLSSSEHGKILKEGIKIVICGKPNVGKSSLLNILLKQSRAIVTDIAGTTRDAIEETAQIKGIPFQLIDTAGILEPRDFIEEEAIKRSHLYIEQADLVLLMFDASEPLTSNDYVLINRLKGRHVLPVLNKIDCENKIDDKQIVKNFSKDKIVKISVLKKKGIEELETALVEHSWHSSTVDTHGILISNVRHVEALKNCQDNLMKACVNFQKKISFEFISEDIKSAVNFLDSITGRNIDCDLLENIFSKFCIGK